MFAMTREEFLSKVGEANKDGIKVNIGDRDMGDSEVGIRCVGKNMWQLYRSWKYGEYTAYFTYDTENEAYFDLLGKLKELQGREDLFTRYEDEPGYFDPYANYRDIYDGEMDEEIFRKEYEKRGLNHYKYQICSSFYFIKESETGIFYENGLWKYYITDDRGGCHDYGAMKTFSTKSDALKYLLTRLQGAKRGDDKWRAEQEKNEKK